ncbi:aldose 1-epimerase family protein [Streptococcus uberis]|uniref:aldose 1-epimerase family protein n=1 Tax=Streptococcus uberis TaxID=1349 RepID=UPI003D36F48D
MALTLENEFLRLSFKDLGGELSSIQDKDGLEYLWQGNPDYWSGQAPVLFPICGSLRNNQTFYDDNRLGLEKGTMPRHGIVRKEYFKGKKVSDNQVTYYLDSSDKMLSSFPYRFSLSVDYYLKGKTITVTYRVKNLESDFSMPFTIGAHPAFNCPLFENESYEDYYLEFSEIENCSSAQVFADSGLVDLDSRQPFLENSRQLALDYGLFKDDTLLLDRLSSKRISLLSRNHEKGLTLNLRDFPFLVLWSTANKGPFIALEPWLGVSTSKNESDRFQDKVNTQLLKPQERQMYSYEINIK